MSRILAPQRVSRTVRASAHPLARRQHLVGRHRGASDDHGVQVVVLLPASTGRSRPPARPFHRNDRRRRGERSRCRGRACRRGHRGCCRGRARRARSAADGSCPSPTPVHAHRRRQPKATVSGPGACARRRRPHRRRPLQRQVGDAPPGSRSGRRGPRQTACDGLSELAVVDGVREVVAGRRRAGVDMQGDVGDEQLPARSARSGRPRGHPWRATPIGERRSGSLSSVGSRRPARAPLPCRRHPDRLRAGRPPRAPARTTPRRRRPAR